MRQSMAFTELSELMLGKVELGVSGTVYETPGGMVPMLPSPVLAYDVVTRPASWLQAPP